MGGAIGNLLDRFVRGFVVDFIDFRVINFPVFNAVSYTHLRAHETVLDLVCRLLLEKKKQIITLLISYLFSFTILSTTIIT